MLEAKTLGKPYAGKPHVRIEEGVRQGNFSLTTLLYWEIIYRYPLIFLMIFFSISDVLKFTKRPSFNLESLK